jgi:hypothetical protein
MGRPVDLRITLLRMLKIQREKISLQYGYEKKLADAAKEKNERVDWSKALRDETELALKIVECLFEIGGKTSQMKVEDGKDEVEQSDFSDDEMKAASAALSKLTRK